MEVKINYESSNSYGIVRLYQRQGKGWKLIDDMEVHHVGCEYGEYDQT